MVPDGSGVAVGEHHGSLRMFPPRRHEPAVQLRAIGGCEIDVVVFETPLGRGRRFVAGGEIEEPVGIGVPEEFLSKSVHIHIGFPEEFLDLLDADRRRGFLNLCLEARCPGNQCASA
jgi:hypothetical protein